MFVERSDLHSLLFSRDNKWLRQTNTSTSLLAPPTTAFTYRAQAVDLPRTSEMHVIQLHSIIIIDLYGRYAVGFYDTKIVVSMCSADLPHRIRLHIRTLIAYGAQMIHLIYNSKKLTDTMYYTNHYVSYGCFAHVFGVEFLVDSSVCVCLCSKMNDRLPSELKKTKKNQQQ